MTSLCDFHCVKMSILLHLFDRPFEAAVVQQNPIVSQIFSLVLVADEL